MIRRIFVIGPGSYSGSFKIFFLTIFTWIYVDPKNITYQIFRVDYFHIARLEKLGFNVNLKRISDYGRVAFAFEGLIMFACATKNLSFGGCSSSDPLADKVIRNIVAERDHAINRSRIMSRNRMDQHVPFNFISVHKNTKSPYEYSDSSETNL